MCALDSNLDFTTDPECVCGTTTREVAGQLVPFTGIPRTGIFATTISYNTDNKLIANSYLGNKL